MGTKKRRVAVGMIGVAMASVSVSASADQLVFGASFSVPNAMLVNQAGTWENGTWYSRDESRIDTAAGPSKFNPEWGSLSHVKLEAWGDSNFNWEVSNSDGWSWPLSMVSAGVGFGGLLPGSDMESDEPEPNSDSGSFSPSLYRMRQGTELAGVLSEFVGVGSVSLPLFSELDYDMNAVEWPDDPFYNMAGEMSGTFWGQIQVTYTYDPPSGFAGVPEPSSALFVPAAALALGARRGRRCHGV